MNIGGWLVAAGLGAMVLAVAAYGFGAAQGGTIAGIVALAATGAGLAVVNERHGSQSKAIDTIPTRHPGS